MPTDFCMAMVVFFSFIKDNNVLAIPIPAINIVLMDIKDKNCEKLLINLFKPEAEFSGFLRFTPGFIYKIDFLFFWKPSEVSYIFF